MSRLLVLAPEPIRPRMAGMGIRAAEIARALAVANHPVTLVSPGDPAEVPAWLLDLGVRPERFDPDRIAHLASRHDAAVVSGHVANELFSRAAPLPTIVDLYDPFLVENLTYAKSLGWGPFRNDHATMALQLSRGDRFLVSSFAQRLFWAGFLLALGRVNPALHQADPGLEALLPIVPFGTPPDPAEPGPPFLRGVVPGIGREDPVLFFGGVYDWYDPEELLGALPAVLAELPDTRLVFVGSPNPDSTPQEAFAKTERIAREKGWLGRNVFFVPWFPYAARGSVYLEATAAVLTHRAGLETELSLRTRGLDFLWAGLPIVAHRGGAMGALIAEGGAGLLVDPGDRAGLAGAITRLLSDARLRQTLSNRGRDLAARFRWKEVLRPVLEFAARPESDPAKGAFRSKAVPDRLPEPSPEALEMIAEPASRGIADRLTNRLEGFFRRR
jgi:glycosyltransferase involved in cell wall biosynthesis